MKTGFFPPLPESLPSSRYAKIGSAGFVAYRLKNLPGDFIVTELSDLAVFEKGRYAVFRLEKRGWNTVDLLVRLARKKKISYDLIRYGGKKDRHAITSQYITVPAGLDLSDEFQWNVTGSEAMSSGGWRVEQVGFSDYEMGPGNIQGNQFSIILRGMHQAELDILKRNQERLLESGMLNYFDEQRFGGYDRDLGLPFFHLMRGDYNMALLAALTGIYPAEKRHARERKLAIREAWGNWKHMASLCQTRSEKAVQKTLATGGSLLDALGQLPGEELSMMFSAYQSWVFNAMLSRLLAREKALQIFRIKARSADFILPCGSWKERGTSFIPEFLKLPGQSTIYADIRAQEVMMELLLEMGMPLASVQGPLTFPVTKLGRAFLKETERRTILPLNLLELADIGEDEVNRNRMRCTVGFTLPSGAYGSMLIKQLTLRCSEK